MMLGRRIVPFVLALLGLLLLVSSLSPVAQAAASWVNVGSPGFSAGTVLFTSLALDNSTPYVAYQDNANSGKATDMKFDGTNRVPVGTAGFSAGGAQYISLALAGSTLYVAYQDNANSDKSTVMRFTDPQSGPNFVVNSSADTDDLICDNVPMDCTLREAINAANALAGADTITFDIPDTDAGCTAANDCIITLSALGSLPDIADDLTIDGSANNGDITIDAASSYRVVSSISSKTLTLKMLSLAHGHATDDGGVIFNAGSTLNLDRVTISESLAARGGNLE